MCGIAGIMLRDGAVVDPKVLDTLAKALRHRGPDGEARHIAGNVGLIRRALPLLIFRLATSPSMNRPVPRLSPTGKSITT